MTGKQLSVSIARPAAEAYELLCVPENLSKWASRMGTLVRLTERNARGVLDFSVARANGSRAYVPLRVVSNGAGCELVLTLFAPELSDENFLIAARQVLENITKL
jgi:hypothetical protein